MKHFKNIFIVLFLLTSGIVKSQSGAVGINTTSPRVKLEVGGSMLIQNSMDIVEINALQDDDTSTFLVQDTGNSVRTLDVSNPTGAALGYIQVYEIYNPNEDWVLNFDTGVDSDNFVMNTISSYYDRELDIGNYASIPYTSAYIENGTWHIISDYPSANNVDAAEIGTWVITTLIYSKDLSKQLGEVRIPLGGNTSGSASSPIID